MITAMLIQIIFLFCPTPRSILTFISKMQIIEITRTLTLLFIFLHLNADASIFTLLLWPELYPVSQSSKERCKAQNVC